MRASEAIARIREGAIPVLDAATQVLVKTELLKFYGFPWPEGTDWETGIKALFDFLVRRFEPLNADAIKREALAELAKFPALGYVPDFHPYYWAGRLDAMKALEKGRPPA